MIVGVTKGYKYKMRYVYAHFPINVNIEKNKDTGLFEVEIRYVLSPCSTVGIAIEEKRKDHCFGESCVLGTIC